MKKINIGIIAHVDSGKTTLSEAMLYLSGALRSAGRVDKGSSFLDDNDIERRRGITIFSKMARFSYGDTEFTLIDTPGHADFSAETERTFQILDYAVFLISASDGVRGQTQFLWKMLETYRIPVFIFVNKMDQPFADASEVLSEIRSGLSDCALEMTSENEEFHELAAACSNEALEEFFSFGKIAPETLKKMISEREMFPCLFGSALRMEGVERLMELLDKYTVKPEYPEDFSARVYKITHDENGNRLTFLKITGGLLRNKSLLADGAGESKINEIRLYSGNKYTLKDAASAGDICALSGLKESFAGQTFGNPGQMPDMQTAPVLSYRVIPPEGTEPAAILPYFRRLEEESPELSIRWDEEQRQIYVSVLGQVQLEVLSSWLAERYKIAVQFDTEEVLFRETLLAPAVGVGHFEPLRHYAEVHLLIEPAPRGSGITVKSALSTDELGKNWQSQVLNSLSGTDLRGVLTGSLLTDVSISLTAGKASVSHSDSGDFREASLRALRQGLMMADNALLEPYYRFILDIPADQAGRALNDLSLMNADFTVPDIDNNKNRCIIKGRASVRKLKDYPAQISAYSRGEGSISMISDGFDLCPDKEAIVTEKGYDPERDMLFPSSSVFCSHGSGYIVPYGEVYSRAHLPVILPGGDAVNEPEAPRVRQPADISLGTSDIEKIIAAYSMANSKDKKSGGKWKRQPPLAAQAVSGRPALRKPPAPFSVEKADILIVDGYNVIFAWKDLTALAHENIDAARDALIDILRKYSSMAGSEVLAVFDAYRVEGCAREQASYDKVKVIFTAEDEIADQYIERFANEHARQKKIAVVTSDGTEQVVTLALGCRIISSREFRNHIEYITESFNSEHNIH